MFEQDYIMRIIKEMIRAVLKLVFHIDAVSPEEEMVEDEVRLENLKKLIDMMNNGDINEAENRLSEWTASGQQEDLLMGLVFYSRLNEKTDDFLEAHQYSREEIQEGLETLIAQYGLENLSEVFL